MLAIYFLRRASIDAQNFLILQWILYNEGKRYPVVSDGEAYRAMIKREGGSEALRQWQALEKAIKPLQEGAASFPAAAIRNDIGKPCTAAAKVQAISIWFHQCMFRDQEIVRTCLSLTPISSQSLAKMKDPFRKTDIPTLSVRQVLSCSSSLAG